MEKAKDFPREYQQELPMPVHIFPNFEKVYTPRGRQTICEQRRPDFTHNDTIKRIQSASDNIEFLKELANKQVEKFKQLNQGRKLPHDIKTDNKLNANKYTANSQQQQQQQRRRRSLGKLESVDHSKRQQQQQQIIFKSGCGALQPFSTKIHDIQGATSDNCECECEWNVGAGTVKYYMKLATDYYQQGFLQNIKYLENLGERNQLRRKRQRQLQQQQEHTDVYAHAFGDSCEKNSNILNSKSISLNTKRITNASSLSGRDIKHKKFNPILCRKRQQIDKKAVDEFPLNNDKIANCEIRVNIKPQTANTRGHQRDFFIANKEIYGKTETETETKTILESKDFNSMNDYLNGNLEYNRTQLQQQPTDDHHQGQQPQTLFHHLTANNHNYSSKVLQLNTLIDNLRELDIQENRTNLPRITLTDYTQKYPNEFESECQIPDSVDDRKKRLNSYIIKQSNLDCSNLDIQRQKHYHSEARPP